MGDGTTLFIPSSYCALGKALNRDRMCSLSLSTRLRKMTTLLAGPDVRKDENHGVALL